jgi:hypothetical protein
LRSLHEESQLAEFLDEAVEPQFASRLAEARGLLAAASLDFAVELPQEWQSLVPSDFGFHNSLRRGDGSLAFVDFEYFGWDDPVKLVSDTAIHPGSNFAEDSRRLLVERLSREFEADDPAFAVRRDALYPLFGMIWCLIILNDYLPDSRSRRVFAIRRNELEARLAGQLDKARRLHQTICERDPDLTPR